MLRGLGFRLRKWYVDCVELDGTAFIGYAARVGLGPLRISYQASLWCPAEGEARSAFTILPAASPRLTGTELRWANRRLGVRGDWRGETLGSRHVLLDEPDIRVEWRCHMPKCEANVTFGASSMQGLGYVEELLLSGSPSNLPIRSLRWGRFCSEESSLVWIEWRGPRPLTLVVLDGTGVAAASLIDDREVRFAGGELTLHDRRSLRTESVGSSVFGTSTWMQSLLPGDVGQWREEKWLSRGRLTRGDGSEHWGWVIHERVSWP